MGLKLFSSCSDSNHGVGRSVQIVGNPNPINFKILKYEKVGKFIVVLIRYPECFNYEGLKILVFENVSTHTIKNLTSIDPHFCNSDTHPSPIARFVPNSKGWRYAISFCKSI